MGDTSAGCCCSSASAFPKSKRLYCLKDRVGFFFGGGCGVCQCFGVFLVREICQSTRLGGQAVSASRCLSHPGTFSFSRQELTASTVLPSVVAMRS